MRLLTLKRLCLSLPGWKTINRRRTWARQNPVQAPRGTRDFAPHEMATRRLVEHTLRRVLNSFNYREIQTPAFEHLDLFLAKSGEGIREELYAFKDKGGRDLCLRPELTAPAMRFYHTRLSREPKPLRVYYLGPCYRYDRPQTGRYREFWQVGVEVVGEIGPRGHAELLALALELFSAAGLKNLVLRVGHLDVLRNLVEEMLGVPRADQAPLMRLVDKKDFDGIRTWASARGLSKPVVDKFLTVFEATRLSDLKSAVAESGAAQGAFDHLEQVLAGLEAFGAPAGRIQFDPTIARGLDYYHGLVFELDCPDLGAEKQLLGGGEYKLAALFDAQQEPTIGFALGFDRLLVALERAHALPEPDVRTDVVVASLVPEAHNTARRLAMAMRAQGQRVELDLTDRGPKKAVQRAMQIKARRVALLGQRELEAATVTLKDMDSGAQESVPLDAAAAAPT